MFFKIMHFKEQWFMEKITERIKFDKSFKFQYHFFTSVTSF